MLTAFNNNQHCSKNTPNPPFYSLITSLQPHWALLSIKSDHIANVLGVSRYIIWYQQCLLPTRPFTQRFPRYETLEGVKEQIQMIPSNIQKLRGNDPSCERIPLNRPGALGQSTTVINSPTKSKHQPLLLAQALSPRTIILLRSSLCLEGRKKRINRAIISTGL